MIESTLAQVQRINDFLTLAEIKIKETTLFPSLHSFLKECKEGRYQGSYEGVAQAIKKRKKALLDQRAFLNDIAFILHNNTRAFLELEYTEEERRACIKIFKENEHLIEKQHRGLIELEELYHCLLIEPGTTALPNGERADPTHFRILFEPTTQLTEQQSAAWRVNWENALKEGEHLMDTPLTLVKLPHHIEN